MDNFIFCCVATKSIPDVECDSAGDEFSSCADLMKNKALQVSVWILAVLAITGNIFVIIWRMKDNEDNVVQSLFIVNLAGADFLMGFYLLIIGIMDVKWQGEYFQHDSTWRSSAACNAAGVLSMLSSEVSVMTLTILTADRLMRIVFTFRFSSLKRKGAIVLCTGTWIIGLLMSIIPVFGISYFYDDEEKFGFYSRSSVCLPLQLSEDRPVGWEYSVALFIAVNFASFLFIFFVYLTIFITNKRSSIRSGSNNRKRENALAKRLFFIILTDFCCWMPIIAIGILSLVGRFDDPDRVAYVWIAVFVLPVNSAINPFLYTFTTTTFRNFIFGRGRNARNQRNVARLRNVRKEGNARNVRNERNRNVGEGAEGVELQVFQERPEVQQEEHEEFEMHEIHKAPEEEIEDKPERQEVKEEEIYETKL